MWIYRHHTTGIYRENDLGANPWPFSSPASPGEPRESEAELRKVEPLARQEHLPALKTAGAVVDESQTSTSCNPLARDLRFKSRALGHERGDSEPSHTAQPAWAL